MLNDYINGLWFTKDNNLYINFGTGERRTLPPKKTSDYVDTIKFSSSDKSILVSMLNNDEKNNLILSEGYIDVNALIKGPSTRSFYKMRDFLITKDKRISERTSSTEEFLPVDSIPHYANYKYWIRKDSFTLKVAKTFGSPIAFMGGNSFFALDEYYKFFMFMEHPEPKKKTGKKQEAIDELVKLTPPLSIKEKINELEKDNKIKSGYYSKTKYSTIVTISKIEGYKEPCCCIRFFVYEYKTYTEIEGARIYVTKSDYIVAKRNNFGEFVTATAQHPAYWNHPMLPLTEDVCKGTKLEYFNKIANEIPEKYRMHMVFLCLQQPVIEQLYKTGYKYIVKSFLKALSCYHIEYGDFSKSFPHYNKNKNLFKALDVNKYQLSLFEESCKNKLLDDKLSNIECFKDLGHVQFVIPDNMSFSSIDNKTFLSLFEMLGENSSYYKITNNFSILKLYIELYGIESFNNKKDFLKKMLVDEDNDENLVVGETFTVGGRDYTRKLQGRYILRDYLNMVKDLESPNLYKCNFATVDQLYNAHNNLSELINTKKAAINLAKFHTAVDKLNKYAYEAKQFSIVVPKEPDELAIEGITLHHCVKSYITRVAEGTTGIVFIRENSDLTKPFFTVEVQKGMVMQVHGFGNCNVEDPELMKFIKDWTSKKSLKLHTTGKGINMVR